jgi:hypothetical protein
MFCDVDGGVISRASWGWIRGFCKAMSTNMYANGFGG